MMQMNWQQMNTLDELTYEMKALLEVVMDGLNNDCCPSNPEDASVVLRQAAEKLIKIREIHEESWEAYRQGLLKESDEEDSDDEDSGDEDSDEDSDDEESDFKIAGLFCEDDSDEYEPTQFNVDLVEEHEDGSATFHISGSKKSMKQLFEAFFCQAVINGVLLTKEKNDKYCAERRALDIVRDFEVLLRTWEDSEELDYDPVVKAKRQELTEALKAL